MKRPYSFCKVNPFTTSVSSSLWHLLCLQLQWLFSMLTSVLYTHTPAPTFPQTLPSLILLSTPTNFHCLTFHGLCFISHIINTVWKHFIRMTTTSFLKLFYLNSLTLEFLNLLHALPCLWLLLCFLHWLLLFQLSQKYCLRLVLWLYLFTLHSAGRAQLFFFFLEFQVIISIKMISSILSQINFQVQISNC